MNEKTKNILCYVLSFLINGGIITSFIIDPCKSLEVLFWIILAIIALAFLGVLVAFVADILYKFFSSSSFEKIYRKYISKHYESKRQVFYERGSEICSKCDADCILQYPLRRYIEDSYCKKRVDLYIKKHKLKIDEPNSSS